MAPVFRLFDLPAELRSNIYHQALLPPTLHVSLTGTRGSGCVESFKLATAEITRSISRSRRRSSDTRKISFDHVIECQNKMVVEPFSLSRLPVNREIYADLMHSLYTKCTWFFSGMDNLVCCLMWLPNHVRMKIRHLSFTFTYISPINNALDFPRLKLQGRDQQWTFRVISILLQSNLHLSTLSMHYSKLDTLLYYMADCGEPMRSEGHQAACAVAEFVWPGVETHLLYRNPQITKDLLECTGEICGVGNVQWRPRGHDRYSTPLSELVVRQPRDSSSDLMVTVKTNRLSRLQYYLIVGKFSYNLVRWGTGTGTRHEAMVE